jgi:ABC-type sulfate transport system substrate-binding protein
VPAQTNNDKSSRFSLTFGRRLLWSSRMKRLLLLLFVLSVGSLVGKEITLLNVSYDPTREFYVEFNDAFAKDWKEKTGDAVTINQSHGGSSSRRVR